MTTRECKRWGLTAMAALAILMTSSCVTAHSHHHHRHHRPHHRHAMAVTGDGTATWQNHERLTPDRCLAMAGPEAYDDDK